MAYTFNWINCCKQSSIKWEKTTKYQHLLGNRSQTSETIFIVCVVESSALQGPGGGFNVFTKLCVFYLLNTWVHHEALTYGEDRPSLSTAKPQSGFTRTLKTAIDKATNCNIARHGYKGEGGGTTNLVFSSAHPFFFVLSLKDVGVATRKCESPLIYCQIKPSFRSGPMWPPKTRQLVM